jgi:hypothetical protein
MYFSSAAVNLTGFISIFAAAMSRNLVPDLVAPSIVAFPSATTGASFDPQFRFVDQHLLHRPLEH